MPEFDYTYTNENPDIIFIDLVADFVHELKHLESKGKKSAIKITESRVGRVAMFKQPVILKFGGYDQVKRVLLNPFRDANPFFHLYEAIWMLAGSKNIKSLELFSSKIASYCSDDGKTANGAYGYRWRKAFHWEDQNGVGYDQLSVIIKHLRNKPSSRRAVLQMWNTQDDLARIDTSKDVCCNTAAYFSIEQNSDGEDCLNMTVTNRSNDAILGLLGANYVHFTILQEYMARALNVKVGTWFQFTTNLHVYLEDNSGFHPKLWINGDTDDGTIHKSPMGLTQYLELYSSPNWFVPLMDNALQVRQFDIACERTSLELDSVSETLEKVKSSVSTEEFKETEKVVFESLTEVLLQWIIKEKERDNGLRFFYGVVYPVLRMYFYYKAYGQTDLYTKEKHLELTGSILADDWRVACSQWVLRRLAKRNVSWASQLILDPYQ